MIKSIQLLFILISCALSFSASAQKLLTNRQIYNFDAGDEFEYRQAITNGGGNLGPYSHILFTILATRISKGNDTLFYTVKQHYYYRPDSANINDITDTVILSYTQLDSVWQTPTYASNKNDSFSWTIDSFNDRLENKYFYIRPNLLHVEHYTQTEKWGDGIGEILSSQWDDSGPWGALLELVYYKKKNEVYGTSFFAGISPMMYWSQNVKLYPNPVKKGNLLIIMGLKPGQKELKIIDMTGRVVFSSLINDSDFSLALKDFSSGVYSIRVNNANDIFTGKFIVMP